MRRVVLLYNPSAPYYAMPLALLALASELGEKGFEPVIVDGRLHRGAARTLISRADEALYLGVTVLTGSPIADALRVSSAVRAARPNLPIVWGGWHPSIFPASCVDEAPIDAAVVAQGEETAVEIAKRLQEGSGLEDTRGVERRDAPATPRPFRSPDSFAPHDYGLLDVEAYFRKKGERQIEYVSSQGCPFACGFCSDPMVYRRRWAGLPSERVVAEIERLTRAHGVTEVAFQDEIYFVDSRRTLRVSEGFLSRGLRLTWTATARVEEILRFTAEDLSLLKRSGLRKLIVGAESGEPEVLSRIRKGIEADQILQAGDVLSRAGIAGHFNFIVGFPFDETPGEVRTTLSAIERLMAGTRLHEFALFYYAPYPGSPIYDEMARSRQDELPRTLPEWARFDYVRRPGSWMSRESYRTVENFKFYRGLAPRQRGLLRPLAALASLRNARGFYAMPLERLMANVLRRHVLGHADL